MAARWDTTTLFPPRDSVAGYAPPDPYARWLLARQGRGLAQWHNWEREDAQDFELQILAHIDDPKDLDKLAKNKQPGVTLADAYLSPVPGCGQRSSFFTAHIRGSAGFNWLRDNPLKLSWKVAMPLRDAQRAAQASPKGRYGPTRDQADMQAANLVEKLFADPKNLDSPNQVQGLITVIDFGCPFLNDRYTKDGPGTRLVGLWDQGQSPSRGLQQGKAHPGWPWQQPAQFHNGRELGPTALADLRNFAHGAQAPEETLIYRGLDYLIAYADPRRRVWYATHGGMVLDLVGGRHDPLDPEAEPDHASRANLLFVDLPTLTAADSAGSSLGAHVLDGVRYAMAAADPAHPLVVVLSYGNGAGPHDGYSLIERALDELIQLRGEEKFAIVLAAGNARADAGHVRRRVARDRSAMLRLQVVEGDTTDTFVEIWYPRSGSALELRVRSPGLVWSPWIMQGQEVLMRSTERPGEFVALLRHDLEVPNGRGAMALLALAPTAQPADVAGALAEPGLWEIELRLADGNAEPVVVEAWIERDDPVRGSHAERTRFVDRDDSDEYNTLSGMATGEFTYKAAGYNRETGRPTRYSSLPAKDRPDPRLLLVACEEDLLQPTVAAAATRSSDVFRMNGTSVAAPVLARRLYNKMAEAQAAPQKRAGRYGNPRPAELPLRAVLKDPQGLVKPFEPD
jgi:hypothetical protein